MQCPCGGETGYYGHQVKKRETAQAWYPGYDGPLPVVVCRDRCTACGRQLMRNPIQPTEEEMSCWQSLEIGALGSIELIE